MQQVSSFVVPGDVNAPERARRFVESLALPGNQIDLVRLLVAEIVSTAIGPGDPPSDLEIEVSRPAGRIHVVVRVPPDLDLRLYLVPKLAAGWGVMRNGSTSVWFDLEKEDDGPQRPR